MCENKQNNNFLTGILLGAAVAVGAAYLMTTDEGKKVAKKIKKEAGPLIEDLVSDLEEKTQDLTEKAEEVKDEVVEKLEEVKENFPTDVQEKLDESLVRIEKLQERGRKAITAIHTPRLFRGIKKPVN